ncbi:SRPBCC domain-containing protein [Hyphococcus flavus]|uniref:SRPBCC domain-containing protein n=1 Tax=Hyphococcus flavus TaxID=1866326 RepID=A0AAE9ZJK4_9PROT|nr:SRPBCC domain-containing protein [Hyphococcus flavus]WDI32286.1 SRPBCC domain-containing protein [Hyphococcus flavus]
MSAPAIIQASLTIEREFDFPVAKVFSAWTSAEAKRQWFARDTDTLKVEEYALDFRPGGVERCNGRHARGTFTNDGVYHYIVENEKIVFTYYMTVGGEPYSVSLETLEFEARGNGTLLKLTEHNAFLAGKDENLSRTEGLKWGLGRLNDAFIEGRL